MTDVHNFFPKKIIPNHFLFYSAFAIADDSSNNNKNNPEVNYIFITVHRTKNKGQQIIIYRAKKKNLVSLLAYLLILHGGGGIDE